MSSPQHKHNSKGPLLTSVADFIGSTLGTIASRASEIPEAVSHSEPGENRDTRREEPGAEKQDESREGSEIPPQRR